MYLWDANILRHFGQGHPTLRLHLSRIPWSEIALPSVVVAEVLRGRCDFALQAAPLVVVTRNQTDCVDLLPKAQLVNWIDDPPG